MPRPVHSPRASGALTPVDPRPIVEKLWGYCSVLRDDGLSYGDYVEQLTLLLFLKLEDEQPPAATLQIPTGYDWSSLIGLEGDALAEHYEAILVRLSNEPGLLGMIFRGARNRIQDPLKLYQLVVELIGKETWSRYGADVTGRIYEGILEKTAGDTKSGAGQYFTPRPLIQAIVEVTRPAPGEMVSDPACGTGGFLLAARDYAKEQPAVYSGEPPVLVTEPLIHGIEIVADTARLCAMNLFLHGVPWTDAQPPVEVGDALAAPPAPVADVVLANPPFGKYGGRAGASSVPFARGTPVEPSDVWAYTNNKQLNFLQRIASSLKAGGRAAVVIPDNVLFEGGAGETIRRELLRSCNVHTLLRLPTGLFYAQGVKANVIFFERGGSTDALWVYDLRTNQRFTLRGRPLQRTDLNGFVTAYAPGRSSTERVETVRFRPWDYEALTTRSGCNLDVWAGVADEKVVDPALLERPEEIARRMIQHASAGLDELMAVSDELRKW